MFNPQIEQKDVGKIRPVGVRNNSLCYGKFKEKSDRTIPKDMSFPRSVVKINNPNMGEWGLHPTQKPVALFEYLIKTYSNEGDTILDFTAGSGTTGVACINTNREFILIEKEMKYCQIAKKRIDAIDPIFRKPVEIKSEVVFPMDEHKYIACCDYCRYYLDNGTGVGWCVALDIETLASGFCDAFICSVCEVED